MALGAPIRGGRQAVARWLSEGIGVGRAVLVRSAGSAPFEIGSTLFVADDGRIAGGVSAGCVEGAAVEAVMAALRGRYREVVRYGVTEEGAGEVGLMCGVAIDVLIEPEVPPEVIVTPGDSAAIAVATVLPPERETAEGCRVILDQHGLRVGTLGDPGADAELEVCSGAALRDETSRTIRVGERDVFIEVLGPARLVVVGASEIAVWLVRLAHVHGFRTTVIDARAAFLTRERFPDAEELLFGWADELAAAAAIDAEASVVALAHDPKFDDPALVAALRGGARYIGALGSRRAHAARLARLRDAGFVDAELARIHAPIGLDLGGHTPADIALGILAEIVGETNRGRRTPTAPDVTAGTVAE